jgi:hypothetical protein
MARTFFIATISCNRYAVGAGELKKFPQSPAFTHWPLHFWLEIVREI